MVSSECNFRFLPELGARFTTGIGSGTSINAAIFESDRFDGQYRPKQPRSRTW